MTTLKLFKTIKNMLNVNNNTDWKLRNVFKINDVLFDGLDVSICQARFSLKH